MAVWGRRTASLREPTGNVPGLSAHGQGLRCAELGTEALRGDHPAALSPHSTEGLRVGVQVTPQHQDPPAPQAETLP